MKREEMKQTIEGIMQKATTSEASIEDASEAVMKVFEKSLEESIGEAAKMFPKGLFRRLGGIKK